VERVLAVLRGSGSDATAPGVLLAAARATVEEERTRLTAGDPPRTVEALAGFALSHSLL
jgi:hypothetical protein